jgi:hypothetical protein
MSSRHLFVIPLLTLALTYHPSSASAAVLSVVPDTSTVTVGDSFGVTIYIDSAGGSINASDGTLSFDSSMIEAKSLAYGTSIFTMWAQNPAIEEDSVTWSGGSSIAFSGNRGRVLRVVFTAKRVGTASLLLPSSSIYADDGLGTNVATAPITSLVTIVNAVTPVPQPSSPASSASEMKKIVVTSPTNPSQDLWYASSTAKLVWEVPSGADAVKTVLSARDTTLPTIQYRPAITEKTVDGLSDGVIYFNIRGHYADGWGPITSYRLKTDTVPPTFSSVSAQYDATSSMMVVFAVATDTYSGVRDFTLLIDSATSTIFTEKDLMNGSYRIPQHLSEGAHVAHIVVADNAGNEVVSQAFPFIVPTQVARGGMSWFFSFTLGSWLLLIAILLAFFSIVMNIILWIHLRQHERRLVRGTDVRKIRSLTLDQLLRLKKEVLAEAHALERAYSRRDITLAEADEIKDMHRHLIELETVIEHHVRAIEKK